MKSPLLAALFVLVPLAGPAVAQPTPGTYVGTTAQGRPFSITVGNGGNITGWTVGYTCPSFGVTVTTTTSCPVTNGNFTCGHGGCSPFVANLQLTGTFSGTTVSGTLLVNHQLNQFTSCCVLTNVSWSATLSMPGSLRFSSASSSSDEGTGTATITVQRTGGSDGAVSVQYSTADGTAVAGQDYGAVSGTLNWSAGDAADKTFDVPILEDGLDESPETVALTLSNPTGGATLGSPASATLTITDNDEPPPLDFFTLPPCRVLDTRNDQPLASGQKRVFPITGVCGIPATASAVSFNVTIVSPSGGGHLTLFPGDDLSPGVSTINFDTGEVLANNAILLLSRDGNGTLAVAPFVVGNGSVHLILDVNGYLE